jgi:hypothetical protein
VDGGGRLEALDRPPPRRRWANGADKARTELRDRQLLEAMHANPTASASGLAHILGDASRSAIVGRWRRLSAQGLLAKDRRGRWRVADRERPAVEPDEVSEFEAPERPPLPASDSRWVRHIDFYTVWNPGLFSWSRFG